MNYGTFKNILYLLKAAYRSYKIVFVFILLEMICGGLMPLFGLYLPRLAVRLAIERPGMEQVLMSLGGFTAVYVILLCVKSTASEGKYQFQNELRFVFLREAYYKALDCDYDIMESGDGHTAYEKARRGVFGGDNSATTRMYNDSAALISGLISFVFIFGIISNLSVLILAALTALSGLNYLIAEGFQKRYKKLRELTHDVYKKHRYLELAMSDVKAAKDMRIYNLTPFFKEKKERLSEKTMKVFGKMNGCIFQEGIVSTVISIIRDGIAYAYCIRQVLNGGVTVPDFVLYMGAVASYSGWFNTIIQNIFILRRANWDINELRFFLEKTNRLDPAKPLSITEITRPINIEFKNVCFRYTADAPNVLDGLSFKIDFNEKAALVGVNGAGKTTVVKLLCGFI